MESTRVVPAKDTVNLPPGFGISVFAEGLNGPRMMTLGPAGGLLISDDSEGFIYRVFYAGE